MIPRSADWKNALACAVRDPAELLGLLDLPHTLLPAARAAAQQFPLRVPRGFVARMEKGDPDDPLLRQVLPLAAELQPAAGFSADPVGDRAAATAPGVLHKYHGRALLMATGACAIHCRYCFRRHFPYGTAGAGDAAAAMQHVTADTQLREVILSGGDPLLLDDDRLARWVEQLAAIPHLERLRIHTRLPVVLPERITPALLRWLTGSRLQPVLVIHCNHPRELDGTVHAALARLAAAGVTLLNQSVLLRGVNDAAETLETLSEALFAARVLPYYLHLLDRVAGAAHFEVPEPRAQELLTELRHNLPGYLVPRLVREQPGAPCKLPVGNTSGP